MRQLRLRFRLATVHLLAVTCIVLSAAGTPGARDRQTPTNPAAAAIAEFQSRIKDYLALRQKHVSEVGKLDGTKEPKEISDREIALGKRIQAARAQAVRGDVFTPGVEALFKKLIQDEYAGRSPAVRTDRREDQDELADFTPRVNQIYPSAKPLVTFPAGLLKVLPKLPVELEYRLVQRNLILRDVEANLIVDFIRAATR